MEILFEVVKLALLSFTIQMTNMRDRVELVGSLLVIFGIRVYREKWRLLNICFGNWLVQRIRLEIRNRRSGVWEYCTSRLWTHAARRCRRLIIHDPIE